MMYRCWAGQKGTYGGGGSEVYCSIRTRSHTRRSPALSGGRCIVVLQCFTQGLGWNIALTRRAGLTCVILGTTLLGITRNKIRNGCVDGVTGDIRG